jgi:hypothetical protein
MPCRTAAKKPPQAEQAEWKYKPKMRKKYLSV